MATKTRQSPKVRRLTFKPPKQKKKQYQHKIGTVLKEFKSGTLTHGATGLPVTDRKMAIAIALNVARREVSKKKKRKVQKIVA